MFGQSNYPSYGGFGGGAFSQNAQYGMGMGMGMQMNSGPPAPNAYSYSAYNNNSFYGCPAVQSTYNAYPMGNQPPPPPPMNNMMNNTMHMMQGMQQMAMSTMDMAMQRQMYSNMGYRAPPMPPQQQQGGQGEEQPAEEPQAEEEEGKQEIPEDFKEKMRNVFIAEMLRRYKVSGTFDMSNGTIVPFQRYTKDDLVSKYFEEKEDQIIYFTEEDSEDVRNDDEGRDAWDPEKDSMFLRHAMKGLGTDDNGVTYIVSTRCNSQRQEINRTFKTAYGRDLFDDLDGELSGYYREAVLASFVSPAYYDAKCIKQAIYGAGTDEQALIELLLTRTNAQIHEMRKVYPEVARPNKVSRDSLLEEDIDGDCSGNFKKLLISAAQGGRAEVTPNKLEKAIEEVEVGGVGTGMYQVNFQKLSNMSMAKRDAEKLYKSGEGRWGTNEEDFNRIFSLRETYQLRSTYDEYVKSQQHTMHVAIDGETSGDLKKGLTAIYEIIYNRPKFFARKLRDAMKGLGTDERTLIRIITSRSEIDMVQIKKEFLDMTRQTLWKYIKNDTSFNFKHVLLSLVGRD